MSLKTTISRSLIYSAVIALAWNCSAQTESAFRKNLEADGGQVASYDQWVSLVGKEKADIMFAANAADGAFNRLTYSLGISNVAVLINGAECAEVLAGLLADPVNGIGPIRVVSLVNGIDQDGDTIRSNNLNGGGAAWGVGLETLNRVIRLVNETDGGAATCAASAAVVVPKLGGFIRAATGGADPALSPLEGADLRKITRLVAHVGTTGAATDAEFNNEIQLINALTTNELVNRLTPVILNGGPAIGDRLVEVIQTTPTFENLVAVIREVDAVDAVAADKLTDVLSRIDNGTKLGWIISNSSGPPVGAFAPAWATSLIGVEKIIFILRTLSAGADVEELADLINAAENPAVIGTGVGFQGRVNNNHLYGDNAAPFGTIDGADNREIPFSAESGVTRLRDLIQAVTDANYLVELLREVDDANILAVAIEDVADDTDLSSLINNVGPLGTAGDGTITVMGRLGLLLNGLSSGGNTAQADAWKARNLVDGCRDADVIADAICNATNQAAYVGHLADLLATLDETTRFSLTQKTVPLADGNGADFAVAGFTGARYPEKLIQLVYLVGESPAATAVKLGRIINAVEPISVAAYDQAVPTLIYLVVNIDEATDLVTLINGVTNGPNAGADAIAFLINDVAEDTPNGSEAQAGIKLETVIDGIQDTDVSGLANVINDMIVAYAPDQNELPRLTEVINRVSAANIGRLVILIDVLGNECSVAIAAGTQENTANCGGTWNATAYAFNEAAGSRVAATGHGRLTNLLLYIDNSFVTKLGALINGLTGANETYILAHLTDNVPNTNNLIGLLLAIEDPANTWTDEPDLRDLINAIPGARAGDANGLLTESVLEGIVQNVTAATETSASVTTESAELTIVAQLIGTVAAGPAVTQGVGTTIMTQLLARLALADGADPDTYPDSGQRLATTLNTVAATVTYDVGTVTKKEAFVRLLLANTTLFPGFTPNNFADVGPTLFPGIGPVHTAILMNNTTDATKLVTLLNSVPLEDAIVTVGCLDHVGDYDGNGIWDGAPYPNFETPCTGIDTSGLGLTW